MEISLKHLINMSIFKHALIGAKIKVPEGYEMHKDKSI